MAKKIKLGQESKQNLMTQFEQWLNATRFLNKKLTFEMPVMTETARAKVNMTATAYMKMQYLIMNFESEVAWHGVAKRVGTASEFIIDDIMLYPQEVTGSTVNTDQQKYQEWLYALDDDHFNNNRFQGHSHVNMGCSPSAVDLEHQDGLLSQVGDDDYYIFGIFNKKGVRNFMIYDLLNNIYFEDKDVDFEVVEDVSGFKAFIDNLGVVTRKTYATGFATGAGYYTGGQTAITNKTTASTAKTAATSTVTEIGTAKTTQAQKVSRADGFDMSDYEWGAYGQYWGD